MLDAKQKQFEEDQKIYGDKVTQLKSTFQNSFKTLKEQVKTLFRIRNNFFGEISSFYFFI